jgi:Cu-Zn family superoxide dismutase
MNRLLAVLAASLALACAGNKASNSSSSSAESYPPAHEPAQHRGAMAQIESRSGSKLVGTARFTSVEGGVTAHIVIAGADAGEHGIHIHEVGDCSDSKAASAGGHFNPAGEPHHGGTTGSARHAGDFGNILVDASGNGSLDLTMPGLSINGDRTGIVGRSIVVHDKSDDLHTDPSGNSGSRLGCGVIKAE